MQPFLPLAAVRALRLCAVILTVLTALMPMRASADAFTDALALIAEGGFANIAQGAERIGESGDPRGAAVLTALNGGQLFVSADKQIVIGRGGAAIDPVDGREIGPLDRTRFEAVRLNNRVRAALQGALGRLGLYAADPAQRIAAARAVLKSRSADNIPLLEKALADEKDARVAAEKSLALAANRLLSPAKDVQLAGIAVLAGSSDAEVRAFLLELRAGTATDAEVRQAAEAAIATIDNRLARIQLFQTVFQGLSLGSVLLLAALGLAITFGVMGVINMAHGEMVMIGAYTTFVVQQVMRAYVPGWMEGSILVAIPAAFLVAGALGVVLERTLIRYLYGRPLETLLMTWGLSMILQQAVRSLFGPTNREVSAPSWMTGSMELFGSVTVTANRLWIILFGLAVLGLVIVVMRWTWFGLQMRAVTQNRSMAAAMGIRTSRVDALTFGLGSGIAGIAGVALSQLDNVSPNLGQGYIVDSFMVVVFGGVGNFLGTLIGAMTLGIVNKVLEPYAGAVLGKIFVLVAIILFIQVRPRGMFALKGRAVEQ